MTLKEHRQKCDGLKAELTALQDQFNTVIEDFRKRMGAKEVELANAAGAFLKGAEDYADAHPTAVVAVAPGK